jgi:hypothetical protein
MVFERVVKVRKSLLEDGAGGQFLREGTTSTKVGR